MSALAFALPHDPGRRDPRRGFWAPKTNNYMIEEVERLWAGDITAQEYMEGWQELHVEEMAEGMVPPAPAR